MSQDTFSAADFLNFMQRYTQSGNDVPVDRVSIRADDLNRLVDMARFGLEAATSSESTSSDLASTVFHVWHTGDDEAGLDGSVAELHIDLDLDSFDDEDRMELITRIKEELAVMFTEVWGEGYHVHVLTDDEFAEMQSIEDGFDSKDLML